MDSLDTKGLYKKSTSGELANMTGIDSPYEIPDNPTLTINSSSTAIDTGAEMILRLINPAK